MDSNIALVLVVVLILGTVIFLRWTDSKDTFERNEAQREYLKEIIIGFRNGLNDGNLNNRLFTDDILRRLGYLQPEGIEAMNRLQQEPETTVSVDPPYTPDHEVIFDMEQSELNQTMNELHREGGSGGWAGES